MSEISKQFREREERMTEVLNKIKELLERGYHPGLIVVAPTKEIFGQSVVKDGVRWELNVDPIFSKTIYDTSGSLVGSFLAVNIYELDLSDLPMLKIHGEEIVNWKKRERWCTCV